VVADELLPERAETLARRLADGPAFAYATTKALLTRELDMGLGSSIEFEAMTQALMMQSADHGEFFRAWNESRRPEWQGR
jgi:enoyl-CoA hydratase/carnithine racemase